MSDKEKRIMEGVSKLPGPLKDRFLDKLEGAAMALDALSADKDTKKGAEHERTEGESR